MTTADRPVPNGVLNLNKPSGMTSRDAVNLVNRALGKQARAGHAGTLDPLASGVLIVCVGRATRLIEYVQRMRKTYRAVVRLGARSDTLDADGQIIETPEAMEASECDLQAVLKTQVGEIQQVPPQFSALKVSGKRAYDEARAGRTVELAPRAVQIDRVDLLTYTWPRLEIEVQCGGGTYIRSIARDVGEALGCGGLIEVLVRTRIGPFTLEDAIDPRTLTPESAFQGLRPAASAVALLPRLRLPVDAVTRVGRGQSLEARRVIRGTETMPSGEVALLDSQGELVAIARHEPETGRIIPRRVLMAI